MWSSLMLGFLLLYLTDAVTAQKRKGCFPEDELLIQAQKFLRRTERRAVHPTAARAVSVASCSDFKPWAFSSDVKNRSLSPWRSRFETDQSLIPEVYEVAECLCSGCIINGSESTDYNSVPVFHSKMFLKRVQCSQDPPKYSLKVVHKTIPVACTCVVPKNTLL